MKLKIYGASDDLVEFELRDRNGKQVWAEEVGGDNCRFLIAIADGPTLGVQAVFDGDFIPESEWVLSVHYNFDTADWPGEIITSTRPNGDPVLEIPLPADVESSITQVVREDGDPFTALFTPSLVVVDSNRA